MSAWVDGAWAENTWYGTVWYVTPVSITVNGGSSSRRRRTWKTTEEVLLELRKEREFKYIPAPEIPAVDISKYVRSDIDFDAIEARITEKIVRAQIQAHQIVRERKLKMRKKKTAIMLLYS